MIKQYTVQPAYTGNDKVTTYIDGISTGYSIMSYWETQGYCNHLEEDGYTKAYDLDELLEEIISAKEAYELAQRRYDEAVPYRLVKPEIGGSDKDETIGCGDMYCIIHKYNEDTWYLAWQNPVWDDSGYFWTSKETFAKCLSDNTDEHPILFRNRAEAIAHLKTINIPQKCSIIRWVE